MANGEYPVNCIKWVLTSSIARCEMVMDKKENVRVAESSKEGQGVFAKRNFNEGDVVLEIDDTHVIENENTLTSEQHAYDLDYLEDKIVLMQSPEKFINHSCDPNTYTKTEDGIRRVIAMRNIKEGEEITYDYSVNGDNDGTFSCHCGSERCRKTYQGDFFKLPKELQIRHLPYLDNWFKNKHKDKIEELDE